MRESFPFIPQPLTSPSNLIFEDGNENVIAVKQALHESVTKQFVRSAMEEQFDAIFSAAVLYLHYRIGLDGLDKQAVTEGFADLLEGIPKSQYGECARRVVTLTNDIIANFIGRAYN